MRPDTLGKVMAMLAVTYDRPFSQEQVQVWNAVLADVEDDAAIEATKRVIAGVSYPPRPADFVRAVEAIRQERLVPKWSPPALNEPMTPAVADRYRDEIRGVLGLKSTEGV